MHKCAVLVCLLAVAAQGQAIVYPNATRSALRRRAEPGPATPGPCADEGEALCAGPEDFCCSTDLECEVDEAAGTYTCVAPDAVCPDDSTLCGETCCPANSSCLADGSCLACLSAESPCGEICCSEGSQCNAETSTCETDDTGTTTTTTVANGSTTTVPSGSTGTRSGTATTPTGPGGSTISIGATSTSPNAASVKKASTALLSGALYLLIAA